MIVVAGCVGVEKSVLSMMSVSGVSQGAPPQLRLFLADSDDHVAASCMPLKWTYVLQSSLLHQTAPTKNTQTLQYISLKVWNFISSTLSEAPPGPVERAANNFCCDALYSKLQCASTSCLRCLKQWSNGDLNGMIWLMSRGQQWMRAWHQVLLFFIFTAIMLFRMWQPTGRPSDEERWCRTLPLAKERVVFMVPVTLNLVWRLILVELSSMLLRCWSLAAYLITFLVKEWWPMFKVLKKRCKNIQSIKQVDLFAFSLKGVLVNLELTFLSI